MQKATHLCIGGDIRALELVGILYVLLDLISTICILHKYSNIMASPYNDT